MARKHPTIWGVKTAWSTAALSLAFILGNPALADPQDAAERPAEQSESEQELTEGLLDLLTEPAPESTQPPAALQDVPNTSSAAPTRPSPLGGTRGMGAKELGTDDLGDGEDLGASSSNPLAEVRMGMLTAAGWLRERSAVDKTEELQRDIVARLDQLIDELDKPSSASSPPPPNSSQTPSPSESAEQSQPPEAAGQAPGTEKKRQQQSESTTPTGEQAQAESPGTQGQPAAGPLDRKGIVVDLKDPTALQRSAWGNLPDRVREQMQSRMVERFLPGYREEIEAYYRALAR